MKSYVTYLQGLYTAIFSEIVESIPTLHVDSKRDSSRLLSLVESQGLPFLTISLVDAGRHFDKCLSAERLLPFGVAGFRPYKRGGVIPRLFKGLLLRVFDESGMLRAVPDVIAIRFLRQLFYAAKKVKIACDDSRTWEHVHEFFETDSEVRLPSLNWDEDELRISELDHLHCGDDTRPGPAPLLDLCDSSSGLDAESISIDSRLYDTTQKVADIVSACLGRFEASEWRYKHGPGAVADQRHTQFKYDFPTWPAKLDHSFPLDVFGFANYTHWAGWTSQGCPMDLYRNHEPPSRLISVPKTLKGPRLIASEPVAHQWCQQAVLDFLTSRLRETPIASSIHFRDQRFNQDLALRASHTGSHATIDLSAASDRISCWLVERMFRRSPTLVQALHASRTRWVVNTIDKKSPQFHKLRKFSCMGSACTFPVQSYIFTIIAISTLLFERGWDVSISNIRRASREVRVFGDDIIIPKDGWGRLQELLGAFGLKVNHNKSHGTGRFRESCGMDAYDGTDVTPTYTITYPDVSRPESITSLLETHNNFFRRGYEKIAAYVKSTVVSLRRFVFPNVPIGSGILGWFSFNDEQEKRVRTRFNPYLHRREYYVDTPRSKSSSIPVQRDSSLLQFFTEATNWVTVKTGPLRGLPDKLLRDEERIGIRTRPVNSIVRRWVAL